MVVAATRPGEPQGRVIVQFPDDAFTVPDMIALLATVEVGPEAAKPTVEENSPGEG
jgi:hypothetical protein